MALEPKKAALNRIYDILKQYSDYKHPMTQEEIRIKLENEYGISLERKAIGRNLNLLKELGIEIESNHSGSYLNYRDFEDSELRMLIDGVLSSKYISKRQSKDIIDRLCGLSNKYFKPHIKHIYTLEDVNDVWNKTENNAVFLNIEIIDEAIEKGKQIFYNYNKYDKNKKLVKSSQQIVSPYQIILHNQRYYLMAYSEYWKNICYHRLDHITNMKMRNENATPLNTIPEFKHGIDYSMFSSTMPYMYTDKPVKVELLASETIIDQIVDWFGKDIVIADYPQDTSKVNVTLKSSQNAMEHWALQYINHVEVISPESLRDRIKKALQGGMDKYK